MTDKQRVVWVVEIKPVDVDWCARGWACFDTREDARTYANQKRRERLNCRVVKYTPA